MNSFAKARHKNQVKVRLRLVKNFDRSQTKNIFERLLRGAIESDFIKKLNRAKCALFFITLIFKL